MSALFKFTTCKSPATGLKLIILASVALLARATCFAAGYIEPGTGSYLASLAAGKAPASVGTFGSFGKGSSVQTSDFEGLLTFNVKKSVPNQSVYWPRFGLGGADYVLGSTVWPGKLVGKSDLEVSDWVTAYLDFETQETGSDKKTTRMYISRAFPAIRYETSVERWKWVSGNNGAAFDRVTYIGASGEPTTVKADASGDTVFDGVGMGAPWLLLWNAPGQPEESRGKDDPGIVPILIRLQTKPSSVTVSRPGRASCEFAFPLGAGSVSIMALRGIRGIRGQEAAGWRIRPPEAILDEAAFWSRVLAAFPVKNDETYDVDDAGGRVTITDKFKYREFKDEWGTEPVRLAPLPPVAGLAMGSGYPVELLGGALETGGVATYLGPYMYRKAEEITYRIPIPAERDRMLLPVRVKGDKFFENLQADLLNYGWQMAPRADDTDWNGNDLKAMAFMYPVLPDSAKHIFRESMDYLFDDTYASDGLQTVTDPTGSRKYLTSSKVWIAEEPYDKEWYNGRQLDWTWVYSYFVDDRAALKQWDVIKGFYDYFRIYSDWAWSGSLSSVFGYTSLSDGMNFSYEGILGAARLARMAGDEAVWKDASYRAAKQALHIYASFDMVDWVKDNDYAVVHWLNKRQPPSEVVEGFSVDGYYEWTGAETLKADSFWEATNFLYWNNPAQLRLYADYKYGLMKDWEYRLMPQLHPKWYDSGAQTPYDIPQRNYGGEWAGAHIIARSILFGEDPKGLDSWVSAFTGVNWNMFGIHAPVRQAVIQAGAPQVWAPVTSAKFISNDWDASSRRLRTVLMGTTTGTAVYEWAWRNKSYQADGGVPAKANPGPRPIGVKVNGKTTPFREVRGGFWQIQIPVVENGKIVVDIAYKK